MKKSEKKSKKKKKTGKRERKGKRVEKKENNVSNVVGALHYRRMPLFLSVKDLLECLAPLSRHEALVDAAC